MRPVELTIEGLRSFRRPVTVDLAGRELVAIIGDTGAGKSSILEALTWALYGNATWTKQAGVLVGDGCPQMRVRCVFDADGNRWQVTRAIKRRGDGTPGPASAELVCVDGDRPAADGVREVNAGVQRLLGLDWEAFTRTVVLPQGQFARLLTETDVERLRILRQIWRTDDLVAARARADEALRELEAHLGRLRGRRESYPDDVDAELAAARTTLGEAERAAEAVEKVAGRVEQCREALEQARVAAGRLRRAVAQLDATLEGDPAAEAVRLASIGADLDAELEGLDERIAAQQERLAALDEPPDDGPDRAATEAAVTTLERLAASLDDLADHRRRIDALHGQARAERAEAEELASRVTAAEERVAEAERAVAHWQRMDAAAAAAHGLHPGNECPVCARSLPEGWAAPDASGLAAATEAVETARRAAQQARDRQRARAAEAKRTTEQAAGEAERLADRLGRVAEAVAGLPEPFRPALPEPFTVEALTPDDLTDALVAPAREAAQARKAALDAREQELRAVRDALHGLGDARNTLVDRRHREVTEPATRLRARLERVCERIDGCAEAGVELAAPVPEVGEQLAELARDAEAVAALAASTRAAADDAATGAETAAGEQEQELARLLAEAGVAAPEELADRQVQARADAQRAQGDVARLEALAPKVAALDAHLADGAGAAGALADLKTLLQDGRFIRWLTVRRSKALLAVASTLLEEMTGGRYAFADITDEHDEWRVFDTETGYARSPKTLSGGESFVASLALALGMVEMVARSGGRLDALFLDEGFGALDRDNLDAAVDALESSATHGRMVAVISHVQAVAERLDDVLAVERAPTGSQARWLPSAEREGLATTDASASVRNLLS